MKMLFAIALMLAIVGCVTQYEPTSRRVDVSSSANDGEPIALNSFSGPIIEAQKSTAQEVFTNSIARRVPVISPVDLPSLSDPLDEFIVFPGFQAIRGNHGLASPSTAGQGGQGGH